jgi:hypothetical protein
MGFGMRPIDVGFVDSAAKKRKEMLDIRGNAM